MSLTVDEARSHVIDCIRANDEWASSGTIDDMDRFALALAQLERAAAEAAESKVNLLRTSVQEIAIAALTACETLAALDRQADSGTSS